jgi:alpha-glucosidase
VAFEDLQDPYGITMWPEFKGRDGCRTAMPWSADAADLGFGSGATRPWLPFAGPHRALAVDRQQADEGSLLHFYTRLLHWRRQHPALVRGDMTLLPGHPQVLAYVRSDGGTKLLCALNFSNAVAEWAPPAGLALAVDMAGSGLAGAARHGAGWRFEPWGGAIAQLA